MVAITMKNFDVLEYVKLARKFGANEELAELQACQIEQVIEVQNQILESQNQRILEYKS